MADTPAIACEGLGKRFGSKLALDHLALSVPPGTVHGLLGPNGAGKTGTSPSAISLVAHRAEFGVGPDLPDLLRAAAGDGDLGSPPQRLLA
jgi:ABC-type phosphonate transport system ATPase subunit